MASMLLQQNVKDFGEWKKVYDQNAGFRTSSGATSSQIYRDAGDPNKVTVLLNWNSLANAQKFVQSPELRAAMEKAGVEGPPSIDFLNEA